MFDILIIMGRIYKSLINIIADDTLIR